MVPPANSPTGSNDDRKPRTKIKVDFLLVDKTTKATRQGIKPTLPPRKIRIFNTRNTVVSAMEQPLIPVITGDNSAEQFLAGF